MVTYADPVLDGKYPANAHAQRVVQLIREKQSDASGLLYLEGRLTVIREDDDSPVHFRQRRHFYYLTGCNLADCHYVYDIASAKSTLFIPPIDADDVIWSGLPLSTDEAKAKYDVDHVQTTDKLSEFLSSYGSANKGAKVFTIKDRVSNSEPLKAFSAIDDELLKPAVEKARVVKDEFEIAMIKKANWISGQAHKAVVERARKATNEQEFEAAFMERCISYGAKEMAYHPIMAAGRAAATLHYVDNNAPTKGKQNLLIDAGAEWDNYASDITRTFPLSGKFTPESQAIYDIVLKMQTETMAALKADVVWDDVHVLAHKVAIDGLLSLGILKGDKEEILAARTSVAFFPHGLGHHLGMDTHDVGGNPNRSDKDILFRYLRLRGPVPAGAVVTVEPGVYFCEFIIEPYLKDEKHSKFIDKAVLDKYWDVGGVRIEDNVAITKDGYENLTTAIKAREEIEAIASAS